MGKEKGHTRNISVDKERDDKKQTEKAQKKFHLDSSEVVLFTMKCTYKSRSGKLRITNEHICYNASLLGKETKKIIAFADILTVTNQPKSDKHHAGVKLELKSGKEFTFHFKDNESAYMIIESQWEATGNQKGSRLEESTEVYIPVKHFNLPESESLQKEYHCAFVSTFKLYGKMYLTRNFICFYSGITSRHQKKLIKLRDIIEISKVESSKHSIKIETKTENYVFTKFNDDRENVYNEMVRIYDSSKNNLSVPGTPLSRSRSGSTSSNVNITLTTSQQQQLLQPTFTNTFDPNALTVGLQNINSKPTSPSSGSSSNPSSRSHSRSNSSNTTPKPAIVITPNQLDQSIEHTVNKKYESPSVSVNNSKPSSRKNSVSSTSTAPTTNSFKPNAVEEKITTTPTLTTVEVVNTPPSPKISERIGKIDSVCPPTVNPNEKKDSNVKATVKKSRTCCFSLF